MMYPFMTLSDGTEIVHSEMLDNGEVKVYFEKPDEKDCFHNATCFLPEYRWENINGFNKNEISDFLDVLKSTAHLILEFSKKGGVENASGF